MNTHKNDLQGLSTRQLLGRRRARRPARRRGTGAGRRADRAGPPGAAGPDCRRADGAPHGPDAYVTPRPAGRGRARYAPAALAGVVRRYLRRGEQADAVLAEISAINAELLARRELR